MEKNLTTENTDDSMAPKQEAISTPDVAQIQREISDKLQPHKFPYLLMVPKPERKFIPGNHLDDPWQGKPSVPYGIIRCLAFHERKKMGHPYIRILFAEGGRKGDPWGGLHLEINGHVYHFGAGMKRFPQYHDGKGGLLPEGNKLIANGLPGEMTFDTTDWRWVQDEADLTSLFSENSIGRIVAHFEALQKGEIPIPYFQSHGWAKRLEMPLKPGYHNCTTIIAEALHAELPEFPFEDFPLKLFDASIKFYEQQKGTSCTDSLTDLEENALLWQPEALLERVMQQMVPPGTDLNAVAKGIAKLPEGLTLKKLVQQIGL